jgi:branched-chain amino acid aminotransferase
LLAGERANEKGYDQALWLDARDRKLVEEVGSMNIFFVIDGTVITPALNGSILPGITRDSVIQLLKAHRIPVDERKISIEEIAAAHAKGRLNEAFGSGTAAVISPVGTLGYNGTDLTINNNKQGKITTFLYDEITGIQNGKKPDPFGWIVKVN